MRHSPRITHICRGQKSLHSLGPYSPPLASVGLPWRSTILGWQYTMALAKRSAGCLTPKVWVRPPRPSPARLPSYFQSSRRRKGTSTLQITTDLPGFMIFVGSTKYRQMMYQPA